MSGKRMKVSPFLRRRLEALGDRQVKILIVVAVSPGPPSRPQASAECLAGEMESYREPLQKTLESAGGKLGEPILFLFPAVLPAAKVLQIDFDSLEFVSAVLEDQSLTASPGGHPLDSGVMQIVWFDRNFVAQGGTAASPMLDTKMINDQRSTS